MSLHQAIGTHDDVAIKAILSSEFFQIDERDASNRTPLHVSVQINALHLTELLIDCGANINAQEDHGWTPVHVAAYYSRSAIGQVLLAKGARVDVVDAMGNLPIYYTTRNRSIEDSTMLGLLLHYGSSIDFLSATRLGMTRAVKDMLISKSMILCDDPRSPDFLSEAVEAGKMDLVELLIAWGCDVNRSLYAPPPLVTAAHFGLEDNLAIARLLLKNGANPQAYSPVIQQTPLDYVLKAQNHAAAELFRQHLATIQSV